MAIAPTFKDGNRPEIIAALRAVLQEDFPEDLEVKRITIQLVGTGEVAYRLHPRDGSDYVGGVAKVNGPS